MNTVLGCTSVYRASLSRRSVLWTVSRSARTGHTHRVLCRSNPTGNTTATQTWFALAHGRRLHGGDRPHGQKVVEAMPPSRPHGNFMPFFETLKRVKPVKVRWFQPENAPKAFGDLAPRPAPQTPIFKDTGSDKRMGRVKDRGRGQCRGVYSIEAWTQPASLKKNEGGRKSCIFSWKLGEQKLRGEERLNYLSTYLHCFPLIFSQNVSLAPLARLHFIFINQSGDAEHMAGAIKSVSLWKVGRKSVDFPSHFCWPDVTKLIT